jgi:hypothetical protein
LVSPVFDQENAGESFRDSRNAAVMGTVVHDRDPGVDSLAFPGERFETAEGHLPGIVIDDHRVYFVHDPPPSLPAAPFSPFVPQSTALAHKEIPGNGIEVQGRFKFKKISATNGHK